MNKPDPKIIEDLKQQYPGRRVVPMKHRVDYGPDAGAEETFHVIALVPNRAEWQLLQRNVADPDRRPRAIEELVRNAVKWPAAPELDAMLDRAPGLASSFGNVLSRLAGASTEAEVGN